MNVQYRIGVAWPIPLDPIERTAQRRDERTEEPSPLARWLDRYFGSTPAERMQEPHLAYWL